MTGGLRSASSHPALRWPSFLAAAPEHTKKDTMLKRLVFIFTTMLVCSVQAASLAAQTSPLGSKPGFSAELVVGGVDPIDPTVAWVGVHVRLDPGWHTYWRSAGDAGAPPEFDWRHSRNVAAADVKWPAPRRITAAGIDTFGYADEVLLPVRLRLRDPQALTNVSLKLALFVCSTICTRNDLRFDAVIPAGARFAGPLAAIDTWRAKVPRANAPGLAIASIELMSVPTPRVQVTVTAAAPLHMPDVFVDGDEAIVAGRPQITARDGHSTAFTLPLDGADATHPRTPLHVTLVDGDQAVESVLKVASAVSHAADAPPIKREPSGRSRTSAWAMLAVALLGGLILNFMPCVFPVLSLKIFSLVTHGVREMRAIRARFVASALGVVTSFLLLATALAALKALGAQVGWGIQFQQPLFLIGMTAILVVLAANLLDLYEIRLPIQLGGIVGRSVGHESLTAHFVNGLAITLLATPCSAPFVGTAVGFALSQGAWQIFEIFAALGVGMASPYLVLATVPRVARAFPRPGRWMLVVRHVAAVAMIGTAIWLLTVLTDIAGVRLALAVGASFGVVVWLLAVHRQRFAHAIAGTLMVGLAGVALLMAGERARPAAPRATGGVRWQPLVPQDIRKLVHNGRTVFVDIGAAWCVTCKVNDALIVGSGAIRKRLTSDVVPVRADWTRPDKAIGAYLQSFGRYGLPFNAVFGPRAPSGIVLPELLTQTAVLDAFDQASAKTPAQ
jgi:suppressor for copper-sensitivity B